MEKLFHLIQARKWAAVAGLAAFAAAYLLVTEVLPRCAETIRLLQEREGQAQQHDLAEHWEDELARLERERLVVQQSFSAQFVRLPRRDQISLVLQVLQEAAEAAGVALVQVRPAPSTIHETYDELPLQLQVEGRYHDIGTFVDRVEQSDYLIKVQELQITSGKDGASALKVSLLVQITLLK